MRIGVQRYSLTWGSLLSYLFVLFFLFAVCFPYLQGTTLWYNTYQLVLSLRVAASSVCKPEWHPNPSITQSPNSPPLRPFFNPTTPPCTNTQPSWVSCWWMLRSFWSSSPPCALRCTSPYRGPPALLPRMTPHTLPNLLAPMTHACWQNVSRFLPSRVRTPLDG